MVVWGIGALLVAGGLACHPGVESDDDNFREDVLYCENAVAYVESCCPGVTPPNDACLYHHYSRETSCGCSSEGSYDDRRTVLGTEASKSILSSTCEQLAYDGGCASRAAQLAENNYTSGSFTCH